jgi:hypothetical protein
VVDVLGDRQAERDSALAAIEGTLDRITETGRDVDPWERQHLVQALGDFLHGLYVLSEVNAHKAAAPLADRGQMRSDAHLNHLDVPAFRKILAHAASEPIVEFPSFGPVRLR